MQQYMHIFCCSAVSARHAQRAGTNIPVPQREREREKYAHMFNIDDVHIYNS